MSGWEAFVIAASVSSVAVAVAAGVMRYSAANQESPANHRRRVLLLTALAIGVGVAYASACINRFLADLVLGLVVGIVVGGLASLVVGLVKSAIAVSIVSGLALVLGLAILSHGTADRNWCSRFGALDDLGRCIGAFVNVVLGWAMIGVAALLILACSLKALRLRLQSIQPDAVSK